VRRERLVTLEGAGARRRLRRAAQGDGRAYGDPG
jgi:hypothetical protein